MATEQCTLLLKSARGFSFGRSGHHASTSGSSSSSNGRKAPTDDEQEEGSNLTAYLAPAALLLGMGLLVGGGFAFKSQLRTFIDYFVEVVDTWGPLRCCSAQ